MRGNMLSLGLKVILLIVAVSLSMTNISAASEKKLHNFGITDTDGVGPYPLIFDAAGNLCGTTRTGGSYTCGSSGCGTVFELSPREDGGWTEKKLHNFGKGTDGSQPRTNLIFDAAGNIYGTTALGGKYNRVRSSNCRPTEAEVGRKKGCTTSVASMMARSPTRASFLMLTATCMEQPQAAEVDSPTAPSMEYGVAARCSNCRPMAAMAGAKGSYITSTSIVSQTGGVPFAGLIFDGAGNLYGTTRGGGDYSRGTVFELTPNGTGGWIHQKLHSFGNGLDGTAPYSALVFDTDGNLYGTTIAGGDYDAGTVFEMTPNGGGGWTEKKIHNFNNSGTDGNVPFAGLIVDAAGNLYGTTEVGGTYGYGTAFKMTPNGSGGWTETKLHNFGNGTDGMEPDTDLIFDAAGNIYGATYSGGNYGDGTVFEIRP